MVGRKSKYTPETVEKIFRAIAQHGSDRSGWEAGEINPDTFYEWKKKYSEFSDVVASAKREFRSLTSDENVVQAKHAFEDYLFGRVWEEWQSEEVKELPNGDVEVKRTVKRVQRGVPQWAILRVLGEYRVLEALKELLAAGVVTPEQAAIVEKGVSEIEENLKKINSK